MMANEQIVNEELDQQQQQFWDQDGNLVTV